MDENLKFFLKTMTFHNPLPSGNINMESYLKITYNKWEPSFFFFLFRAAPVAYGSCQARGWKGTAAAGLHHSHSSARSGATSSTYTTTHSKARSFIHWVRPGMEPESSWVLVRFRTCWATVGTPNENHLREPS